MRPFGLALLLVAVTGTGLAACRGKPGESCSDSPATCLDKASHLVCLEGKYVLESCRGNGGCTDDKSVLCDNTSAQVGDGCGHNGARACKRVRRRAKNAARVRRRQARWDQDVPRRAWLPHGAGRRRAL